MANASQLQLNPYALFDPSQFSNPYSNYQSSPLPGASYAGVPTNYAGQPIQMPPGMTINQTPAQPAPAPASQQGPATLQQLYGSAPGASALNPSGNGAMLWDNWGGFTGPSGMIANDAAMRGQPMGSNALMNPGYGQAAAAQPAAPATNNAGLTPQQYMQLRANPGPVPTYGATVPQSPSSAQPGTGVLQSFLQNWRPASSGPGSAFQQGFASSLKGMGYS